MKQIVFIFILGLGLTMSSFSSLEPKNYQVKTIVIDAGHGGKDPGCLNSKVKEKELALDISLKLGEIIQKNLPGVKVIYTRKDDRFIELHDRAAIANKNNADIFISVHVNSGPSGMHGTETYCMGLHKAQENLEIAQRENASIFLENEHEENYDGFDPNAPESYILFSLYQNAFLQNSMRLAENIEKQFKSKVKRHSRGVKQAGFLVLWKTSMPSVLVETGFLSDSSDAAFLTNTDNRQLMAESIYNAVVEYKNELEESN